MPLPQPSVYSEPEETVEYRSQGYEDHHSHYSHKVSANGHTGQHPDGRQSHRISRPAPGWKTVPQNFPLIAIPPYSHIRLKFFRSALFCSFFRLSLLPQFLRYRLPVFCISVAFCTQMFYGLRLCIPGHTLRRSGSPWQKEVL